MVGLIGSSCRPRTSLLGFISSLSYTMCITLFYPLDFKSLFHKESFLLMLYLEEGIYVANFKIGLIPAHHCWRPNVVLKVLRWSWGSLSPLNSSSWGNLNFDGTRHSRTVVVKGESVALTILSRLQSVFSLMAFLNLSISFLISLEDLSSVYLE